MMTSNFVSVIVIRTGERRFLAEPLDQTQERYFQILGSVGACFHQSIRQRQATREKPDAPAKGHLMMSDVPTCRNQQSPLSGPLQAPSDTFVRGTCKNSVKRLAHGFNKNPMPV